MPNFINFLDVTELCSVLWDSYTNKEPRFVRFSGDIDKNEVMLYVVGQQHKAKGEENP